MSKELKAYSVVASSETENYINGETNLAFEAYDADDVDALLAEKDEEIDKQKWRGDEWAKSCNQKDKEIESLKASHYAEMVDAGMRERRLKRALWLARAKRAKDKQQLFHFSLGYQALTIEGFYDPHKGCRMLSPKKWIKIFNNVENKCRAKAEEYK